MKRYQPAVVLFVLMIFALLGSGRRCRALPKFGVTSIDSPDGHYALKLSEGAGIPGEYILTLMRSNVRISQYSFSGELMNAYWSPSGKYVAINNHNGHNGFYLRVISLDTAKIITSHGAVNGLRYDRYEDDHFGPDLFEGSKNAMRKVYSKVDKDTMREGYNNYIAYGWKNANCLLVFQEYVFSRLLRDSNDTIQVFGVFCIDVDSHLRLNSVCAKLSKADATDALPMQVEQAYKF